MNDTADSRSAHPSRGHTISEPKPTTSVKCVSCGDRVLDYVFCRDFSLLGLSESQRWQQIRGLQARDPHSCKHYHFRGRMKGVTSRTTPVDCFRRERRHILHGYANDSSLRTNQNCIVFLLPSPQETILESAIKSLVLKIAPTNPPQRRCKLSSISSHAFSQGCDFLMRPTDMTSNV